jgi:Flp pilus assembly protein TadG
MKETMRATTSPLPTHLHSASPCLQHKERGQVLVVAALLLPILLGMTALAIDLGNYAATRRHLQNSADAIALAAAQDLPDANAARTSAQTWAAHNNIDWSTVTFSVTGGSVSPQVSVSISRSQAFAFIGALGVGSRNVGATAVAGKFSPQGVGGAMPWAITQDTINAVQPGQDVTIKQGAGGGTTGNYDMMDIDGTGKSTYKTTIEEGAQGVLCSTGMAGCNSTSCPGNFPSPCAENAASCTGPSCSPETGNGVGPTDQAVAYRLSLTTPQCSTFAGAFTAPPAPGGQYLLNPAGNPWGAGRCPVPDDGVTLCSRQVIVIPIVDTFGSGKSTNVNVLGFALFFLEGSSGGVVTGRFVNANVDMNAFSNSYDPNSLTHFVKLIQ